jgi:kinetochor protein Mis14/NSL1
MESQHRKIELQSPADLTFLTNQLRTAARQKLDLHLPPVSDTSEPDELRRNVEDLVDAFVAQVLAGMRSNISINGIDVVQRSSEDDSEEAMEVDGGNAVEKEEYEVFDEKLRGKLSSTVAKRDALISKISQHRRTTPGVAAAAFQSQFEKENEALLRGHEGVDVNVDMEVASVEALKREEEVSRNWQRAVEGLGRLNKGLPETRARLERAGDVVGYLGGEGGK